MLCWTNIRLSSSLCFYRYRNRYLVVDIGAFIELEGFKIICLDLGWHNFFREEVSDDMIDSLIFLELFIIMQFLKFCFSFRRPGMNHKESNIIGKHIMKGDRKIEIHGRYFFFCVLQSLPDSSIAFARLQKIMLVVVVDCHIRIIGNFYICNLVITQILLIDLFADDVQSHIIFLLYHDLHLVQDKFKFFPSIHWSVSFHLHFL